MWEGADPDVVGMPAGGAVIDVHAADADAVVACTLPGAGVADARTFPVKCH